MPIPKETCHSLRSSLDALHEKREEFDRILEQAVASGDFSSAQILRETMKEEAARLREFLSPFETEIPFQEQYAGKIAILKRVGLIETLPSGEDGIIGIDGNGYPLPSYDAIESKLFAEVGHYETKTKQGFQELRITPFGIPLEKLIDTARQVILDHYAKDPKKRIPDPARTRLWSRDQDGTRVPLELDTSEPLMDWADHAGADADGQIIYFPEVFDADPKKHKGTTKKALLEDTTQSFPGFLVSLCESGPIPAQGDGKTIEGRKQLEANQSPEAYLRTLKENKDGAYEGESGETLEEWLIRLITHLEETDEVIDDFRGDGKENYLLGGWLPADGNVSYVCWARGNRRAYVDRDGVGGRDERSGSRTAVRV